MTASAVMFSLLSLFPATNPTRAEMERDASRAAASLPTACGTSSPGKATASAVRTFQVDGEHLHGVVDLTLQTADASGAAQTCSEAWRFEYILTQHGWEFDGLKERDKSPAPAAAETPAPQPPPPAAVPAAPPAAAPGSPPARAGADDKPLKRKKSTAKEEEEDGDDDDDSTEERSSPGGVGAGAALVHLGCGAPPACLMLAATCLSPLGCLGWAALFASGPIGLFSVALSSSLGFVGLIVLASGALLCAPVALLGALGILGSAGAATTAAIINRALAKSFGHDVSFGRFALFELGPVAAAVGALALYGLVTMVGLALTGGAVGVIVGLAIASDSDNTGPILGTSIPLGVSLMAAGAVVSILATGILGAGMTAGAVGAVLAVVLN